MCKKLVRELQSCPDAEYGCSQCEFQKTLNCREHLMKKAADAIEELSKLADAIPHVCECCIGCEVESGGCDRGFVLSPKRAKEYLSKRRWIPVMEEQDGKV